MASIPFSSLRTKMFDSICFALFALHRKRLRDWKRVGVRNGLLVDPIALLSTRAKIMYH